MERRDVGELFRALAPVGTVKAVRREYRVFRSAGGDYLVFSPSSRGGSSYHMTVVEGGRVETLARVVGREGVTTGALLKEGKVAGFSGSGDRTAARFDVLMTLYVLAAMGRVTMKKEGRNLVFTKRIQDE